MYVVPKGQLIKEGNFGVFKTPKKQTFCEGFLTYEARAEITINERALLGSMLLPTLM